jgi:hypothetical protein
MAQIDTLTNVGAVVSTDLALILRGGANVLGTLGSMVGQNSTAVTITGGTINGTTIGATTPASVAATTGTFSSTLASGGITTTGNTAANAATAGEGKYFPNNAYGAFVYGQGTTYDVALGQRTTGVALGVLAGTTNVVIPTGSVGIGTSSVGAKLHLKDTTGSAVKLLELETAWSSPSGNKSIEWTDATNTLGRISVDYTSPKASMRFGSLYNSGYQTGDVMTLTADGNVGIGNSAPTQTLEVTGGIRATVTPSNTVQASLLLANAATTSAANLQLNTSGGLSVWSYESGGAGWFNSATIASSGSVGIGVVPIAHHYKSLEIGNAGSQITGRTEADTYFMSGLYWSSSSTIKYAVSSVPVGYYNITNGAHSWNNSAAGTAGNDATINTAMTLDASGNLGLGVTPSAWGSTVVGLDVGSAGSFWGTKSGNTLVAMSDNSYFNGSAYIARSAGVGSKYYQNAGAHYWETAASASAGAVQSNTTLMTLAASGNLLVGTTSFGGNVGVQARGSAGGATDEPLATSVGGTGSIVQIGFFNPNGRVGYVATSGTSTSYSTSSDYRLKEDAVPMTGATERVKALRPINFAWKADGSRTDGFLAHEAQEVVPEAVHGTKDAMRDEKYEVTPAVEEVRDDDGNVTTEAIAAVMGTRSVPDYQGIDQSKLVPLLTAALQEAIANIEALTARLEALEGAN